MIASTDKFLGLEGLRGILALLVCVGHLGLNTVLSAYGLHVRFELAVDVFFVMSGFVLSHAYFFSVRPLSHFVVGRVARLYPLHLATLLVSYAIANAWFTKLDQVVFLQNVFLLQNIGLPPYAAGYNFPSWSISVEFWVGIAYFFAMRSQHAFKILFAVIACLPMAVFLPNYLGVQAGNYAEVINGGLLRGVIGFAVGVSSYVVFRKLTAYRLPAWILWALMTSLALLFAGESSSKNQALAVTHALCFYSVSFASMIALSKTTFDGRIAVVAFTFWGAISYSVYLLHIPVYSFMEHVAGETAVRGVGKLWVLCVILILATLSATFFEKPIQRWILRSILTKRSNS